MGQKSSRKANHQDITEEDFYPDYFIKNVSLNEQDIDLTSSTWNIIKSGISTTPFEEKRKSEDFYHLSTSTWFYEIFYDDFFRRCPLSIPLFDNIGQISRGKLIAGLFSISLGVLFNQDEVVRNLEKIASSHHNMGVDPFYYGEMGRSLFWSLEVVLASDFDDRKRLAWTKLYSFMLSVIIPVAVDLRRKSLPVSIENS